MKIKKKKWTKTKLFYYMNVKNIFINVLCSAFSFP